VLFDLRYMPPAHVDVLDYIDRFYNPPAPTLDVGVRESNPP
jgi:hypothetical protein